MHRRVVAVAQGLATAVTVGLFSFSANAAPPPPAVAQMAGQLDGNSGLIGRGWFDADSESARWTGAEAEARLALTDRLGPRVLHLSAAAGPVATTLQVLIENQVLERIQLAAYQPVSLHLPLSDSLNGKTARIRLLTGPTWSPAAFGTPGDTRMLGVRVRGLGITAAPVPAVAGINVPLEGAAGLLGKGWSETDGEGSRWTGADAEARLAVPTGQGARLLCVAATAGPIPTTFRVGVNERQVQQAKLEPNQPVSLRLPLPAKSAGAVIRVHVGATPTWVPADFGYVRDPRSLGVKVQALAVIDSGTKECPVPVAPAPQEGAAKPH